MAAVDSFRRAGAVIMTVVVVAGAVWWAVVVFSNLGVEPVYGEDGTLVIDKYSRAKDIFALVLPLLTAALGYWFGSQGTVKAEEKAGEAEAKADVARERELMLTSIAAQAPADGGRTILEEARRLYPEQFGVSEAQR